MTAYAQSMALGSARAGAARLVAEARRFPMLEPQEEYILAKRWREHGDTAAAHRLVTSHLRLVVKIALSYRGYGLPITEVISEGNVGLMQAVKRFDPDRGFRLTTYAIWWIRASIHQFILRSWSLVRMGTTANQKKLFFSLRKAKSKISALEEGDMRPDQVKLIANRLGVPEQEVIDMNRRLAGDASLNAPIRADSDSGEWQDWLVDEAASPERAMVESEELDLRRKALGEALGVLNSRERRIFEARRLADEPITLDELADEFGVSRERVRQIETRAFEKVRHRVIHVLGAAQASALTSVRARHQTAWHRPEPRGMRSTSVRSVVNSAACLLAAFLAVSMLIRAQDSMRDGPTDELIAPWCRVGSLDSWQGRPCVVPMRTGSAEETAGPR